MKRIRTLPLKDIIVNDAFWGGYMRMVREKVIPYQWEVLNDRIPSATKSHCIKNFEIAAKRREGEFYGVCFRDSDLYKWLESVAYSLASQPDPKLEKLADEAIELIGAAQGLDGYINTYYTLKEPNGRWTNLAWGHEMYCGGHMIEAAAAYFYATGKREFLDIAIRFADCLDKTFGDKPHKRQGYPGHQEIELALFKLYEVTGESRFLKLAEYFIRGRGDSPNFFDQEREQESYTSIYPELEYLPRSYSQSHIPPAEQRNAAGHAVRAVYMYSAMADVAAETGDKALMEACAALCDDVVNRQMYVTGAIGSAETGESFTTAYDLPNDVIYGETCASVGLAMLMGRMNRIYADARYSDTVELALYNTVLAGISIKGTEFFYVNPLEVEPERIAASPNHKHVKTVRQKWFDVACCPTNIARTVMSVGSYAYGASGGRLYVNMYLGSSVKHDGKSVTVKTGYPYGNEAVITADGGRYTLCLRSPGSAPVLSLAINGQKQDFSVTNGYIELEGDFQGDEIRLAFDMRPRQVYCAPGVQSNIGKSAVMRGPLVYCMEQVDNGERLGAFLLPSGAVFKECPPPEGLPSETVALKADVHKYRSANGSLYSKEPPKLQKAEVTLIPYFLWANRGENEMRVYIRTEPLLPR